MPSIVADAGPLIALFDRNDRHHRRAVDFVTSCKERLVTNIPVLTEATHLLDFSAAAQRELLIWAHRSLIIDENTKDDLPRIAAIIMKYRDSPADFADASLIALAERRGLREIATIDSDFAIYRTHAKHTLHNVFPVTG